MKLCRSCELGAHSRSGQFFGTELQKIYLIYRIVLVFENFKKLLNYHLAPVIWGKNENFDLHATRATYCRHCRSFRIQLLKIYLLGSNVSNFENAQKG